VKSGHARTYVLLTLAQLFWAGNVVLGRGVRGSLSPAALIFWRWIIALAILLPFAGRELWQQRRLLQARWKMLGLMGFLGVFLYQAMAYQALTMSPALNILLISASTPLMIVLINWIAHRQAISPRLGAGILLSLVGVLAVVCRGDPRVLFNLHGSSGDLLMLAAIFVWAVYSILMQRCRPKELSPTGLVTIVALAGFVFAIPFYFWRVAQGEPVAFTVPSVMALIYIGIFASVLAYGFWNEGIAAGGANVAGLFVNLMPIFGAALAVFFLGETFAVYHVTGAVLVFGGILLGIDWQGLR
jgi:drug/metabolite transporter (DMT)-like permease